MMECQGKYDIGCSIYADWDIVDLLQAGIITKTSGETISLYLSNFSQEKKHHQLRFQALLSR